MLAGDFVEHEEMPGLAPGREGVGQLFAMFRAAFPDVRWDVQDVFADGDTVIVRTHVSGTNEGEFMGMPATGKSIRGVQLIDILRFGDDGLVHKHWGVFDMLTLMQQIGAIPGPPA